MESLWVDLGIRVDQIPFYALFASCKIPTTHILKYLITKIYKHMNIETFNTFAHHAQ
jgi:hypothetical protein